MNLIVLNDQPGQFPVVDSFKIFQQTHALDLPFNVVESLGEESHQGKKKEIE